MPCAATLVSTCFFQLWLGTLVLGAIFVPALHPEFWVFVHDNIGWPLSIAVIIGWHIVSQIFLNRYVTDGKRIKRPFVWLFAYVALSSAYCVVRCLDYPQVQRQPWCETCVPRVLCTLCIL